MCSLLIEYTEKRTEAVCNTALTFLEPPCLDCTSMHVQILSMGSFEVKSFKEWRFEHVFTCLCTRLPLVVLCLGMSNLTGGDQHVQKTSHCTLVYLLVYLNLSYQAEYTTLWYVWPYLQVPRFLHLGVRNIGYVIWLMIILYWKPDYKGICKF